MVCVCCMLPWRVEGLRGNFKWRMYAKFAHGYGILWTHPHGKAHSWWQPRKIRNCPGMWEYGRRIQIILINSTKIVSGLRLKMWVYLLKQILSVWLKYFLHILFIYDRNSLNSMDIISVCQWPCITHLIH